MFSTGLLVSAGTTIAIAALDKLSEDLGWNWLGVTIKLAVPIVGMVLAVYFLEHNALLRWLR